MNIMTWAVWAIVLMLQNYAFTYVSRARNSGSLKKHVIAAIFSNLVWIVQLFILAGEMIKCMTGERGPWMAVVTAVYYTTFTVIGSVVAHYVALKTEKGKGAVGANQKYAQITTEEWTEVVRLIKKEGNYENVSGR